MSASWIIHSLIQKTVESNTKIRIYQNLQNKENPDNENMDTNYIMYGVKEKLTE